MPEPAERRFNLFDGMVLVAASAPAIALIKVGMGLGLFEVGKLTEAGGRTAPLARQLVEFFNVSGGCVLAGLVPAVLILGLYKARPSRVEAAQGPGMVACLVAALASLLPIVYFVGNVLIEMSGPFPTYSVAFNNMFGRWMFAAGPMILGAWIALVILGRWKIQPAWTDRAGCVLGACFVLAYLYAEVYFVIISPLTYWLKKP